MTRVPDIQSEPMAPAIVISAFLLLILIGSALVWSQWGPGPEQELAARHQAEVRSGLHFPPLEISDRELQASRQAHYLEPDLSESEEELSLLYSLVRKANVAQFPHHDPDAAPNLEELDQRLRFTADEILTASGVQGFQSVGNPIFERCSRGVSELIHALQGGELPLSQALEDPPASRFRLYRENCGNMLPVLIERQLLTPEGRWNHTYHHILLDVIQRYRWADLVHTRYPTERQLSPYDIEIFYRWAIEDPRAFTLAERRRFLAQARGILPPDYDFDLARARLDVANQSLEMAIDRFAQLANDHPDNELYAALYEELRRQLTRSALR